MNIAQQWFFNRTAVAADAAAIGPSQQEKERQEMTLSAKKYTVESVGPASTDSCGRL